MPPLPLAGAVAVESIREAPHPVQHRQPPAIMIVVIILSVLIVLGAGLTFRRFLLRCAGRFESMSPDSVSSLFPDRPIRPLPKRRLRERLSPDVADSIQYPPAPQTTTPLFSYPYNLKEEEAEVTGAGGRERRSDLEGSYAPRRHGIGGESDEDDASLRRAVVTRAPPEALGRSARAPSKQEPSRHSNPQPPSSTTSSADGYDSFENTNNKKKRKIPTAGDISINGGHGLNESGSAPGSAALPSVEGHGEVPSTTSAPYYGSGSLLSGGQGISGPGRGRYGRVRNGRSPLRALSDGTNNWAGRNAKLRPPQWATQTTENTGIISHAIANAEKLPSLQGQENLSLLQQQQQQQLQQQSSKSSPASSQFTFTCDSQVPGTLAWPGSDPRTSSMHQSPAQGHYPKGTQPVYPSSSVAGEAQGAGMPQNGAAKGGASRQGGAFPKKSRRSAAKDYQIAARKRREETARQNAINPPKPEDQWVCEFCEYERIFGYPPVALIRQYEMKDRKLRQQEEERKRVWEKAKARSRKGKKGAKMPAKSNTGAPTHPGDGHHTPSMNNNQSQGTQSEEYYDDEYEDDEDYDVDDEIPALIPPPVQEGTQAGAVGHPGGGTIGDPATL